MNEMSFWQIGIAYATLIFLLIVLVIGFIAAWANGAPTTHSTGMRNLIDVWDKFWRKGNVLPIFVTFLTLYFLFFALFPSWRAKMFGLGFFGFIISLALFGATMKSDPNNPFKYTFAKLAFLTAIVLMVWHFGGKDWIDQIQSKMTQKTNDEKMEFDVIVGTEWTRPVEFPPNLWTDYYVDRPMVARGDGGESFKVKPNPDISVKHHFHTIEFQMDDKKAGNGKVHFAFHK